MLAKQLKQEKLGRQREFIKKMSNATDQDGNAMGYIYKRALYPENVAYFEVEGFKIIPTKIHDLPVVLLSFAEVVLTDEKVEASLEVATIEADIERDFLIK